VLDTGFAVGPILHLNQRSRLTSLSTYFLLLSAAVIISLFKCNTDRVIMMHMLRFSFTSFLFTPGTKYGRWTCKVNLQGRMQTALSSASHWPGMHVGYVLAPAILQ
jgi:hypothetical protein